MDRKVKIQVIDEFMTTEANDKNAESEIKVMYSRKHHSGATPDGTPEWRDCTEVLLEGLALTLRDALVDPMLCEHAADMLADRLRQRIAELRVELPGMDSHLHKHISGIMNLH